MNKKYKQAEDFTPGTYVMNRKAFGDYYFSIIVSKKVTEEYVPIGAKTDSYVYVRPLESNHLVLLNKKDCFSLDLENLNKKKEHYVEVLNHLLNIEKELNNES